MKAVVLAAGLGTRLLPLTKRWPKPAVPLLGQPLLRYTLGVLAKAGVKEVGLNTHYLAATMSQVAQAEAARLHMKLSLSYEAEIQGTAGGIRGLRALVQDSDVFVVCNGDALFTPALAALLAEHRARGALGTMVLVPMPAAGSYGSVEVDSLGRVRRIAGRGPGGEGLTSLHFSGVHLLGPRIFEAMSPSGPEDINRDVYPRLLQQGAPIFGAVVDAPWRDVGTPGGYLLAQRALLTGEVPDVFGEASPFARAALVGGVWMASTARLLGTAQPPAFLDEGAVVEEGAHVGPNVYVGRGVRVEAHSTVSDAALLEGSVPAGAQQGVVCWQGGRLPA
jgi:mannose-1-phosphate guanylyltransferase